MCHKSKVIFERFRHPCVRINHSNEIIARDFGNILSFKAKYKIEDAIFDLKKAFEKKLLPDSLHNEKYFNIKRMQSIKLI